MLQPQLDEGFHPQYLQILEISRTREILYQNALSPANELQPESAPKAAIPKVYRSAVPMKKLSFSLIKPNRQSSYQLSRNTTNTSPDVPHKDKFNGEGKFLTEIFQKPLYTNVYDKNKSEDRLPDEPTSRKRRLSSPYDHSSKTFVQLVDSPPQTSPDIAFDSSFECGNLSQVYRGSTPNDYYILLEDDTNTRGYNQWFFFSVRNLPVSTISFSIVNMNKQSSLYSRGLQISVWTESRGWHKAGENIIYYNSKAKRKHRPDSTYYCLSFDYTPERSGSTIYFALNQPYSFSRLINLFDNIQRMDLPASISVVEKIIGFTHSNNALLALRVQIKSPSPQTQKIILVLARQHPGQTVSSFVCEGLIDQLLRRGPETMYLLKKYTFVILPMVNPDGVIYGHSRCNLAGLDINRQWGQSALKQLNPETYFIWKYIRQLQTNAQISFVLDFHGHSKKTGCFLYGCRLENWSETKLFDQILSRVQKTFVSQSCRYGQQSDKVNTIRCQLFKEVFRNCFTLETSFYGWRDKQTIVHYNEETLKQIGKSLIKGIFIALAPQNISYKLSGTSRNRIQLTTITISERLQDIESASEKSESQPDADNIPDQQYTQILGLPPTQLSSIASVVKNGQSRPKRCQLLKLNAFKQKKRLSTVAANVIADVQKIIPKKTDLTQSQRPTLPTFNKKSIEALFSRKRNCLTIRKEIPKLRLTLVADSVERQMFSSLEIIRRERELIACDRQLEFRPKDSFRKQSSSYINYKVYKRRLNLSQSSSSKPQKVSSNQTSKLFQTIQYSIPKRTKESQVGLYDFPIF